MPSAWGSRVRTASQRTESVQCFTVAIAESRKSMKMLCSLQNKISSSLLKVLKDGECKPVVASALKVDVDVANQRAAREMSGSCCCSSNRSMFSASFHLPPARFDLHFGASRVSIRCCSLHYVQHDAARPLYYFRACQQDGTRPAPASLLGYMYIADSQPWWKPHRADRAQDPQQVPSSEHADDPVVYKVLAR